MLLPNIQNLEGLIEYEFGYVNQIDSLEIIGDINYLSETDFLKGIPTSINSGEVSKLVFYYKINNQYEYKYEGDLNVYVYNKDLFTEEFSEYLIKDIEYAPIYRSLNIFENEIPLIIEITDYGYEVKVTNDKLPFKQISVTKVPHKLPDTIFSVDKSFDLIFWRVC